MTTIQLSFAQIENNEYTRGIELKKHGAWEAALTAWWDGRVNLEQNGTVDPRIGFAFIELATENEAKNDYEKACDMYFWGLSAAGWIAQPKAILQEAERVIPLLKENEAKRWRELVKNQDQSIVTEIARFWVEKDPTPSTAYNERLIQHWERIAYARKNFKKSIKKLYKTDDRGIIFVKYGEPDREKILYLGSDVTEMMRWTELSNDGTGKPLSFSQLKSKMEKYMLRPQCEVWLYYTLNEDDNAIFIFGDEEGLGAFRLVNGIEDLIPRNSFRRDQARWTGLPAGTMLQTMYYSELMAFDSFFESRYLELESAWTQALGHAIKSGSTAHVTGAFYNTTRGITTRFEMMNKDKIKRKEMIASTFDFRSATATAKEFFGVDIEELKKGDYELAVQVADKNSSQRKRRMALFEVVER